MLVEWRNLMYNYRLLIQYDGGRYDGWQRMGKDNSTNTVEVKITDILNKMSGENIELFCGCRTEKGVHAHGQVANFKLNKYYETTEIYNYLNRYLPRDIGILSVENVDERFHSQLNAKYKTYVYRLDIGDVADVFERKYAYHTFDRPYIKDMQAAAELFKGEHDFKVFTTAKKSKSTVRNITELDIDEKGNIVEISITANDFLHNMARYIIGVLLDVGNGTRKLESVKDLLDGKDATMSLPAESYGLFLECIEY